MKIDLDQIRNLLAVFGQTDITELTIESGDEKITVKKAGTVSVVANPIIAAAESSLSAPLAAGHSAPVAVAAPSAAPTPKVDNNHVESSPEANGLVPITSPMVGTFYRAANPNAPAFVNVGDRVNVGQTVCIIEAMKLMNDLPAEIAGKVVKVLADNGTTVEFGQPLFLVDPKG